MVDGIQLGRVFTMFEKEEVTTTSRGKNPINISKILSYMSIPHCRALLNVLSVCVALNGISLFVQ